MQTTEQNFLGNCYGCCHLKLNENTEWKGNCICPFNDIEDREREITDRACIYKNVKNKNDLNIFPNKFEYIGKALYISDDKINKWIKEGTSWLKLNPEEYVFTVTSGDTMVFIIRKEGRFYIQVAKNYYETSLSENEI